MVMMPVVRFTSLRSTPGSFRVTRSTDALHAAQCIPEMSYFSSRMIGLHSAGGVYPPGVFFSNLNIYPHGVFVKALSRPAVKKSRQRARDP